MAPNSSSKQEVFNKGFLQSELGACQPVLRIQMQDKMSILYSPSYTANEGRSSIPLSLTQNQISMKIEAALFNEADLVTFDD
jgi:hypothetical protein